MTEAQAAQFQAADPRINAFVAASAGSGKTKTLIDRVARLLLANVKPEAILCITYTKAAAAEMLGRLFERLGQWSVMDNEPLAEALGDLTGQAVSPRDPETLGRARSLFARALETPGGLKVQTIHAFCEKLLKRFPLEAGVSPAFQVMDDAQSGQIVRAARDEVASLARGSENVLLADAYRLLAIQVDAAAFEQLLADIETRRLGLTAYFDQVGGLEAAHRRVWEQCGFPEGPVRRADMEALFDRSIDRPLLREALSFWARGTRTQMKMLPALSRILEAEGMAYADICAALFTDDRAGTPRKALFSEGPIRAEAALAARVEAELERLQLVKNLILAHDLAQISCAALTLAQAYLDSYGRAKAARQALDFSDLIDRTEKLLTRNHMAAWVLFKLDGGIEHVLLDEAQDTAPEQWRILSALTGEFFVGEGRQRGSNLPRRTLFVVGDEKQSIYSFQGADPARLATESQSYARQVLESGGEFRDIKLNRSFRSTPQVLQVVDQVFANPDLRQGLGQQTVPLCHSAHRATHSGCVDLWPLDIATALEDRSGWQPQEGQDQEPAVRKLARRIAETIRAMVAERQGIHDPGSGQIRPVRFGDILILTRKRSAVYVETLRALKRLGIPVAGADRLKLSSHIALHDLLSLLRFVLFAQDDLNLAALLKTPFIGLEDDELYGLARGRGKAALWSVLGAQADAHPRLGAAKAFLDQALEQALLRPLAFCTWALHYRDSEGQTARARFAGRMGEEVIDVLDALVQQVEAAQMRGVQTLEQIAAELTRLDTELKREMDKGRDQVRVMTTHGAKGLEAPVVFLPETLQFPSNAARLIRTESGDWLYPRISPPGLRVLASAKAAQAERAAHEALRLFYVALTRARDRLIVAGAVNEKKQAVAARDWYGHLAAAFPHLPQPARTVIEGGFEYQRFGPDPQVCDADGQATDLVSDRPDWLRLAPHPEPTWAGVHAASGLGRPRQGPVTSMLPGSPGAPRPYRRGDLIHRLLQLLPDLEPDQWAEAAARLLAREADLTPADRQDLTQAALGVLNAADTALLFGPGSRPEVALAGQSSRLPPGMTIAARVDRLVVTADRVIVADFKTNRVVPATVASVDPAYIVQMASYWAILGEIFPGRTIEAVLVWTTGPKLMPLPEKLMMKALSELRDTVETHLVSA